jgi:hypothetical protein
MATGTARPIWSSKCFCRPPPIEIGRPSSTCTSSNGVREYWLADPEGQYVEVFILENDRFVRLGAFGKDDAFVSPVLGDLSVKVGELLAA